jgi:cob(I)alamin adenosyltransferase
MDSSNAAVSAAKSFYTNSDIRAELKKITEQKISTPAQTDENNMERIGSSIARLSSKSVDGLERLSSELQEMQKLLRLEVERVQSAIDSASAGIQVLTDVIAPWKRNTSASQSPSTNASDVHADPPTSLNT